MTKLHYKVLFFVQGMSPSAEQRSEALNFGPHVAFRNANFINDEDNVEDCDAVYGAVPKKYAKRYPWACSIVDFYAGKLDIDPMAPAEAAGGGLAPTGSDMAEFDPFAATPDRSRTNWTPQG